MLDEEVKREGRIIRVRIGGVSAEKSFRTEKYARVVERRLLISKGARERFFRPERRR